MENNWIGKLVRTFTSFLPVEESRKGYCIDCGMCCKLPVECPFLKIEDGRSRCSIHPLRPLNCRKYPRNKKEHLTQETCGFYF